MNKHMVKGSITNLVFTGLLICIANVQAAPIYDTRVIFHNPGGSGTPLITNTTYAYDEANNHVISNPFPSSLDSSYASADISNNVIKLEANNTDKAYHYSYSFDSAGSMEINDLIFTDTNNPGMGGTIQVSVNYLISRASNTVSNSFTSYVRLGVSTEGRSNPVSAAYTTRLFTVPLDVPVVFGFEGRISNFFGSDTTFYDPKTNSNHANTIFSTASLGISSNPFNLSAGITANSLDFGIVNNTIAPASAVPVPAAAWLFGSGLIGLLGIAKRKKV